MSATHVGGVLQSHRSCYRCPRLNRFEWQGRQRGIEQEDTLFETDIPPCWCKQGLCTRPYKQSPYYAFCLAVNPGCASFFSEQRCSCSHCLSRPQLEARMRSTVYKRWECHPPIPVITFLGTGKLRSKVLGGETVHVHIYQILTLNTSLFTQTNETIHLMSCRERSWESNHNPPTGARLQPEPAQPHTERERQPQSRQLNKSYFLD